MFAILLTACPSPSSMLTPPPAAPTTATAVVGARTPIRSVDAPLAQATPGAPRFALQPPMPSSTARATTPPSAARMPRPTRTLRPATHPLGYPRR